MSPPRVSVHSPARRQAEHSSQSISYRAPVVLYTSADCWRGAGISYIGIAAALDACGYRPHVIATDELVASEFKHAGISVEHFPGSRRGEAWRLRSRLGEIRSAAVVVDRVHDLRVGTLAVAGTNQPLIFRYNHFGSAPPADALVRISYWTVLREVIFLSSSARERILREIPFMRRVRSTTIHEGVDASEFRPYSRAATEFRAKYGLGSDPFLLAVGALAPEKKYDVLLDALRLLGTAAPRLIVLGDGPEAARLRERACALAIDVRFLGRIARCNLIGAYNAASGLVHAGNVETFGLAVLEAMSCGRPVIASAGGALPEVIGSNGVCGTLVTPGSVVEMAESIRGLLADPSGAERMGTRARERARRLFSLTAMQRSYARLVGRHVGYPIAPRA